MIFGRGDSSVEIIYRPYLSIDPAPPLLPFAFRLLPFAFERSERVCKGLLIV